MAEKSSAKIVYLHGDLRLNVIETRNLPSIDVITGHILRCVTFDSCPEDKPSAGSDDLKLRSGGWKIIATDPYVKVSVHQAVVARTRVISGWFPLENSRKDSTLHLEMECIPYERNPLYRHDIAGDPVQKGIQNTYFPVRKGSQVPLYQDAHIRPESKMPEIELDGGRFFQHNSCWEDICCISLAHPMIYIVRWSIFHEIKLIREPNRPLLRGGDLTLGELLKYKSEEGVRVLLLVWDDKTSHKKFFVNTP